MELNYYNPDYVSQADILSTLNNGDLVEIEFISLREDKRVVRLFEVEDKINHVYCLKNNHMSFTVWVNEFVEKEYEPIIKSVIRKEDLDKIKQPYTISDNNVNDININGSNKLR